MEPYHHSEAIMPYPNRQRLRQVWLVDWEDGQTDVQIVVPDLTMDLILNLVRNDRPGMPFTLRQLDVGAMQYGLKGKRQMLYTSESRRINQDGMIVGI